MLVSGIAARPLVRFFLAVSAEGQHAEASVPNRLMEHAPRLTHVTQLAALIRDGVSENCRLDSGQSILNQIPRKPSAQVLRQVECFFLFSALGCVRQKDGELLQLVWPH